MKKIRNFSLFIIILICLALILPSSISASTKEVSKSKTKTDLTITINDDGTIKPIKNAERLSISELDEVLLTMGFQENDLLQIDKAMKIDIVQNGGKLKSVILQDVEYSTYDYVNNVQYKFKGKSFDEVHQQVDTKHKLLNNTIAGITTNDWDITDPSHRWKGKTYVIYYGRTSDNSERKYNAYVSFQWDYQPLYRGKDDFGIHWSVPANKWASNHGNRVYITGDKGGQHDLSVTADTGSVYGTKWTFDWYTPFLIYSANGYGRQEIRVPTSHTGTVVIQGGYLHRHIPTSGAIVFGPVGLNFSTSTGDQWKWTESFTAND